MSLLSLRKARFNTQEWHFNADELHGLPRYANSAQDIAFAAVHSHLHTYS